MPLTETMEKTTVSLQVPVRLPGQTTSLRLADFFLSLLPWNCESLLVETLTVIKSIRRH